MAGYFRVSKRQADAVIDNSRSTVRQWRTIADSLRIPAREQERIAPAFRLAD